jgi:hypothetical protein
MLSIACLVATANSVHGLTAMPLTWSRTPVDSATPVPQSRAQPTLVAVLVVRLVQIREEINGMFVGSNSPSFN